MSHLFTKTRREAPADEVSKNAQLLIRGGFINKEMAGVYDYLPLGLKVLRKIENIIREEMDFIGGQEISMSSLQRKEIWERTDRWSDEKVDNWFKTSLKDGTELGLGFTHEEPISNMLEQFVSSYRELPFSVYQFQTKFRNETRAKSGVMRTREFVMKDLYSFSKNQEEHENFYEKAKGAYLNIFRKVGLGDYTYLTFASGGVFSKYSHEFQTLTDAGEDVIYVSKEKNIAINKEVYNDEVLENLGISKEELVEEKAVEVGNIFTLGTRFADPYLKYKKEDGEEELVFMGSYGIGPGRVMGTVVETLSDEKGIIWPESIAPFKVHLVSLGNDEKVISETESLYKNLNEAGIEVILDDREAASNGEKLADADLLGMPYRVIVSSKSLEAGGVEVKKRNEADAKIVALGEVISLLK